MGISVKSMEWLFCPLLPGRIGIWKVEALRHRVGVTIVSVGGTSLYDRRHRLGVSCGILPDISSGTPHIS